MYYFAVKIPFTVRRSCKNNLSSDGFSHSWDIDCSLLENQAAGTLPASAGLVLVCVSGLTSKWVLGKTEHWTNLCNFSLHVMQLALLHVPCSCTWGITNIFAVFLKTEHIYFYNRDLPIKHHANIKWIWNSASFESVSHSCVEYANVNKGIARINN